MAKCLAFACDKQLSRRALPGGPFLGPAVRGQLDRSAAD